MPPASTSPSTTSSNRPGATWLTAMMNTRVVTRPSFRPNTISRSQSPRCGCCSLICSIDIVALLLLIAYTCSIVTRVSTSKASPTRRVSATLFDLSLLRGCAGLLSRSASIDGDDLSRDVAGALRGEKQHGGGQLSRFADTLHGRGGVIEGFSSFDNGLGHARRKHTWRNSVHANAARAPFYRQGACQVDDGGFAGIVPNGVELATAQAGDRGHIDDRSFALFEHMVADCLGHKERAGDVGVKHLLPAFQGMAFGGRAPCQPGIIHQHIDFAKVVHDLLHQLPGRTGVRYIARQRPHCDSPIFQEF